MHHSIEKVNNYKIGNMGIGVISKDLQGGPLLEVQGEDARSMFDSNMGRFSYK